MKKYNYITPGVITGKENNKDLFIRCTEFEKDYSEDTFHSHPNSFEFYIILKGDLHFTSEKGKSIRAIKGDIIYFEENEAHKIDLVYEYVQMLLVKQIGSTKN